MTFPHFLLGYIDPGTVQHVFGFLAPILGGLLIVLGFLTWPLRMAYHRLRGKYRSLSGFGKGAAWFGTATVAAASTVGLAMLFAGNRDVVQAKQSGSRAFQRVIVLGMDGLDPNILEEMMAAGELPNFADLAQQGGYARLQTSNPPESPVAWSTIATGSGPGEHGIFDFLHRHPRNYVPYLSLRKSVSGVFGTKYEPARQRDGFWAYTSAANVPTTVIRWPVAFPAEEVTGRFLSGFGVPDLIGGEGRYAYYTSAPADDDPSARNLVAVDWDGQKLKTELEGPATGRNKHARVALELTRTGDDRAEISLAGGEAVEATLGEWTPLVPVRFSVSFRGVHGQVKFLLLQLEPDLRLVVSPIHMDPDRQAYPFTWPESFGAELKERLGPFHTLGMPEQVHPLSHERYGYDEFLAECNAVNRERRAMLREELDRFDKGLLAFVFDTSDRLQHAFWATRDPRHPAYDSSEAAQYQHVIPDMYREMDDVLGEVLAKVDDQTALILLSDHGFGSFRRAVHLNRWLIDNGYMTLTDPEAEGRDLFQDVDWSKTKAYAMGFASLYLNVAGREGNGIVDSGDQYDRLCNEIADKLRDWRDPDTGEPVFHNVYLNRQLYDGPTTAEGPDLILGLNAGYRASWQTALGGAPRALIEDNTKRWSGDHLVDPSLVPGILLSNQKLALENPRLVDICPTVLYCFGIAPPDHVTGTPLFEPSE